MKTVSVITARGGSKGIPRKNILPIKGRPLIWYTINASKNSNVDETWVSTDDVEIAEVSQKYGAKVLWRPAELANDSIMPDASLVHFAENIDFSTLVFIQPTSPLLDYNHINSGLAMMSKYDSIFSAYREHWLPRWNTDVTPADWDINNRPRRQDVKERFVENGAFYITTKQQLLKTNLRYSGNIGIFEMSLDQSYQLDSIDDLKVLEKLL
tara:strand:+ start:7334 stop:7966 length:633 start_codon:yes stop_codon:yes gene_type:complete